MCKCFTFGFIALLLLLGGFQAQAQIESTLPTYFQYSEEELQHLSSLKSNAMITKEELINWDQFVQELEKKIPLTEGRASRLYAYLYTAQRDGSFLSNNAHGHFMGSLNPLSFQVIKLFYPSAALNSSEPASDEYSNYLGKIVFKKIKERFERENAGLKDYPIKKDPGLWQSEKKPFGLSIGSWQPWFINSAKDYRAPQLPPYDKKDYWETQVKQVKEAQEVLSEHKKKAIAYWANNAGPGSGDWIAILNNYLFSHEVPLNKVLLVRSVFADAFCDTLMVAFDSKYTYWSKRPAMVNSDIKAQIETPNHPSYPSGHSTVSAMAGVLLSHYFPEERKEWYALAGEAGFSRIWAGIHFPVDHQNGYQIGQSIAQTIMQMPQNNL